ncbi:MAG: glycosyltransferase [Bacteroidota bacterium]
MRILFVGWQFPEYDTNGGGLRLFEIIQTVAKWNIPLAFLSCSNNSLEYRHALEDLGVRCYLKDSSWKELVDRYYEKFDVVIIERYHIYNQLASKLRRLFPESHFVLDTVDIHHIRSAMEANFNSHIADMQSVEQVRHNELAAAFDADSIWVVNQKEKDFLLAEGVTGGYESAIRVVSSVHRIHNHFRGFEKRSGVVFMGSYNHRPNVDAMRYFMEEIFPLLSESFSELSVEFIGHAPSDLARELIELCRPGMFHGYVKNHKVFLSKKRVGIAPLRFGAGVKIKIWEYLAAGLPCVVSPCAIDGMGLDSSNGVIIAETPGDFANAVGMLYSDHNLWTNLSEAGRRHIREHLSSDKIEIQLRKALGYFD